MKRFSSKHVALKVDVPQDRKIYCLQMRPYIFQPGNFPDWASDGVKTDGSDLMRFEWPHCRTANGASVSASSGQVKGVSEINSLN